MGVCCSKNPLYYENDSLFSENGIEYDLNSIFKITRKKEPQPCKVFKLVWILEFVDLSSEEDIQRIQKVDSTAIIIYQDEEKKYVVIDGIHRLYRACVRNQENIYAILITREQLESCRITK